MMEECRLIPFKEHHIDQIVNIHRLAFPDFFLTLFGPRFLKLFYKSFLKEKTGVSWVAARFSHAQIQPPWQTLIIKQQIQEKTFRMQGEELENTLLPISVAKYVLINTGKR